MNKRKEKLLKKLKNKAYRDAFVSELIDTGIPFQIRALRGDLTQKTFGEKIGMHQERVHVLEDPNYSKFNIKTLKKIASKLNIGLVVRFVPISDLAKWELSLSSDSLKVISYEDDPYFQEDDEIASIALSKGYKIKTGTPDNQVIDFNQIRANRSEKITFNSVNTIPDGMQKIALRY